MGSHTITANNLFEKLKTDGLYYVIYIASVLFSLYHIYTSSFGIIGVWRHRGVHLLSLLFLAFVSCPYKLDNLRGNLLRTSIKFLNMLIPIVILWILFMVINFHAEIYHRMGDPKTIDIAVTLILFFLITEGARKTLGLPMMFVVVLFLIYLFLGDKIPGLMGHQKYSLSFIADRMYISTNGILGPPVGVSSTHIIMFVIFAGFLNASGAGKAITELALSLTGTARGGPAKTAVLASALMGTMAGSPAANVVGTGAFTIPLMKRLGYKPEFAGGVEAAASTGGMIMPPVMGASVFLMAEFTDTPYFTICKYSALSALLFFLAVFAMVHFESIKRKIDPLPKSECPPLKPVLIKSWHYFISIVVLIYMLFGGYSPMRCALFATGSLIVLSWFKKDTRMGLKLIIEGLKSSAKIGVIVGAACAAAGLVSGVIVMTGLGLKLSTGIIVLSQGKLFYALIFTMFASIFLGMGVIATSAYIILAAVAAPALIELGVDIVTAHLFIYYFGMMSNVTPPVAVTAYAAAGIAESDQLKTALIGLKLCSVGFIVPFMFVYDMRLMLRGDITYLPVVIITSIFGVILLAGAMQKYLWTELSWPETLLFICSSLLLIYPNMHSSLLGFGMAMIGLTLQFLKKKKRQAAPKVESDCY